MLIPPLLPFRCCKASLPVLDFRHRCVLGIIRWCDVWFSKKFIEESAGCRWFRQINVHKHRAGGVEHLTVVGIARDHGGDFNLIIFDVLQHLLVERTIGIINSVLGRIVDGAKTIRQLLRGLIGE